MRCPELEQRLHESFYEEMDVETLAWAMINAPVEKLEMIVMATGRRPDYHLAYSPLKRLLHLQKEMDR